MNSQHSVDVKQLFILKHLALVEVLSNFLFPQFYSGQFAEFFFRYVCSKESSSMSIVQAQQLRFSTRYSVPNQVIQNITSQNIV